METIQVENLSFSYAQSKALFHNVTFSLNEGSIMCILGQNGTGKTTLLNCILGLVKSNTGNVKIFGKPTMEYSRKELSALIAFVPQLTSIPFDYTVFEFVLMGCSPRLSVFSTPSKDMERDVLNTLDNLGLYRFRDRSIRQLSGGELQLTYIARALSQKPRIIILDEPTSALDYAKSYMLLDILNKLKDEGYTIIFSCHNPDYSFYFMDTTAAFLPSGDFQVGKTKEILTDELLSKIYGIKMKKIAIPGTNQIVCRHVLEVL